VKFTRRSALWLPLLVRRSDGRARFRYAICSETFVGMSFAAACKAARRTGYDGIEIEPAHLGADPAALTAAQRREVRGLLANEGLGCPGLHSLFKSPAGLHLTTRDAALRAKSWEYFKRLVDLAADVADAPVMVLGSARQRAAAGVVTPAEAARRLSEGLAALAPHAEARGVTILMEPLAPHLCNVVTTLEEAMGVVRAVGSRAVQTIFDTHNTSAEPLPHAETIKKHFPHIRHVHLNEMDGRRPGAGGFPFGEVLRALLNLGYRHWVSVEVFDFLPDGETVARQAREYLAKAESEAARTLKPSQ
jgi:sugar phosphate isomerase/epimerase